MRCSRRLPRESVLLPLVLACLLSGCGASNESRSSAKESRRLFHSVMEGKLRQLDRGIATIAYAPSDSASMDVLRQRQRALHDRLDDMTTASDLRWHSMKDSVEVEYRELRDQYATLDRGASTTSARAEPDTLGMSGGVQTN
jgi:hypothetical protein